MWGSIDRSNKRRRRKSAGYSMDSQVEIHLPKQKKPGFQPVQPPAMSSSPFMSINTTSLPFVPFNLSHTSSAFGQHGGTLGPFPHVGFFEDEPPLLDELGINTAHIMQKTFAILNPIRMNLHIHEDGDLSGPSLIFMLFGLFQLLSGKVHFGFILGWLSVASIFLYFIFNMLVSSEGHGPGIELYRCSSFVGYSLLPMVMFSAFSLFLPRGCMLATSLLASLAVIWCTRACTSLLMTVAPHAREHRILIAYSCGLIYTSFSLLVLF